MSSVSPLESFRPLKHVPPSTVAGALLFKLRLIADFQVRTVERAVRSFLSSMKGRVADIGCGLGPYRPLFERFGVEYVGLDSSEADHFSYDNPFVLHFDGAHLSLPDYALDGFICTEVLEHVENPVQLIDEMYRVLKFGGEGLITVPWSARYHYIPYDYYRYTPVTLNSLFRAFSSVRIVPRGTDITVIASKSILLLLRNARKAMRGNIFAFLALFVLLPFVVPAWIMGHVSLLFNIGSADDPLGYAVWVKK